MEIIEKKEIFYVRHANTSGASNEDRDICDIGLSPLGLQQIELVAKRFEGQRFDAVLSSPLVRAVMTAAAIADKLEGEPTIEIVPELIEKGSTPNYSGESLDYLSRYYKRLCLCKDNIYGGPGGEFKNKSDRDSTMRAKAVTKYLQERFPYGSKILVVSHGSFGNSFLPAAVGMKETGFILSIFNTSVSKIKYTTDGKKRLSFVNDISHLSPILPNYQFDV